VGKGKEGNGGERSLAAATRLPPGRRGRRGEGGLLFLGLPVGLASVLFLVAMRVVAKGHLDEKLAATGVFCTKGLDKL
jgi:hypothetical protein